MRGYDFFIVEIIAESVNFIKMPKQNRKLYHHDGEQLGFYEKYISKHMAGCSWNLTLQETKNSNSICLTKFVLKRTSNAIFNMKKKLT